MPFNPPHLDYHGLAPEIIVTLTLAVVLVADLFLDRSRKWLLSNLAAFGLVCAMAPILSLALSSTDVRSMAGGAYVVDNFALVLKGLFLGVGFVVLLMSINYVDEGDYYEGEFYFLLLCSLLGMMVMASARDLITIFVALETLSIPAYLLAAWRKRDDKSNEAGLKYYLMGVFASGVMLYGMSLIFGVTGSTVLTEISQKLGNDHSAIVTLGVVFCVIGFAFKVSAVPFHTWAPDTYEGAPTPVTAFLSVLSKAAGFVAIIELVYVGFFGQHDVWQPMFWALAAASMTVGNLVALRQTNIVRLFAYSSIAQGGYIIAPLAVATLANRNDDLSAIVVYLLAYGAMNLGAFAVILAVARKTRSGEISSYGGLFEYAPGLAVLMTAGGVGTVAGSLAARFKGAWEWRRAYQVGLGCMAFDLLACAMLPSFWLLLPVFVIGGFGNGFALVHDRLLLSHAAPESMHGRLFALQKACTSGAFAISFLSAGAMIAFGGVQIAFLAAGIGLLCVIVAVSPRLRAAWPTPAPPAPSPA